MCNFCLFPLNYFQGNRNIDASITEMHKNLHKNFKTNNIHYSRQNDRIICTKMSKMLKLSVCVMHNFKIHLTISNQQQKQPKKNRLNFKNKFTEKWKSQQMMVACAILMIFFPDFFLQLNCAFNSLCVFFELFSFFASF